MKVLGVPVVGLPAAGIGALIGSRRPPPRCRSG